MSIAARVKGIFDPKDLLLEYVSVCYDGCIFILRHLCTCSEETLFMPTGSCCIFVMLSFFDLLCIYLGCKPVMHPLGRKPAGHLCFFQRGCMRAGLASVVQYLGFHVLNETNPGFMLEVLQMFKGGWLGIFRSCHHCQYEPETVEGVSGLAA